MASALQIDVDYEFCAPRFFDFMNEETEAEIQRIELWFETALSYPPSPFMMKIKPERHIQLDSICCDFGEMKPEPADAGSQKEEPTLEPLRIIESGLDADKKGSNKSKCLVELVTSTMVQGGKSLMNCTPKAPQIPAIESGLDADKKDSNKSKCPIELVTSTMVQGGKSLMNCTPKAPQISAKGAAPTSAKSLMNCTPKAPQIPAIESGLDADKKDSNKAKCPVEQVRSTMVQGRKSLMNCTPKAPQFSAKGAVPTSARIKPKSVVRCTGSVAAKNMTSTDIVQENQAIKRQKLEGGGSRKIHTVKRDRVLLHKSKPGLTSGVDIVGSARKGHQEERTDLLMRQETTPFISMAEMVRKFQSNTRDRSLSQESTASMIRSRPRLTLTRPKEPEFETAHRVRAVRVKGTAELEEEMLAKIPKFKARPVNKKILEAPSLPALPRSAPHPPEFKEFHLKTMERASQHMEKSTSVLSSSIDSLSQNQGKFLKLTEPRPPLLETSLRARPSKVKSTQELELDELEKIPKFKAKPLNKKVLESRGDLGLFCNSKRQVTNPQEFHFATNERLGPPVFVDLFDKLSLHSESNSEQFPRITIPDPFHLYTEERGQEKERQLAVQLLQKELEEERARIPRANPYPYTTDYPVIPPKPEPKQCTKPEAFQLESLMRHEEEMQRKMEEKERMEKEEAQRRIFKAQPILKDDPIPLPEKERKPLTEVQEFLLHVDHRASDRAEFDKKMKEKEITYKRLREENETSKMIEEEKAVKHMRKTMVPHARPLPKFDNPFLPQKSMMEATKPKSPRLNVVRREEERRRHLLCGGVLRAGSGSAPGYHHMR